MPKTRFRRLNGPTTTFAAGRRQPTAPASIGSPASDRQVSRLFFPQAEIRGAAGAPGSPIEAVINTDDVDRYGTIVDPRGGRLDSFMANPVLQWSHGLDAEIGTWTVGRVLSIVRSDRALVARLQFDMADPLGAELDRKYREKWLRGFSIGFLPIASVVEWSDGVEVVRFTDWELVELSCASVPVNPYALARSLATRAPGRRGAPLVRSLEELDFRNPAVLQAIVEAIVATYAAEFSSMLRDVVRLGERALPPNLQRAPSHATSPQALIVRHLVEAMEPVFRQATRDALGSMSARV